MLGASALSTDFDAWSAIDRRRTNATRARAVEAEDGERVGGREETVARDPRKPSVVDRRLCPANENEQLVVVMDAFEIKSRV